ncbi:MAG: hypothetical protein GXO05_05235 [Aquificae bacterium]|nr:hypothetical protein [Aquificota bacterium]
MVRLVYLFLFLAGFFAGFILTFPADMIVARFLTQHNVSYSLVEGNIFGLKIKQLEKDNIYLPELGLKYSFPMEVRAYMDMKNYITLNPVTMNGEINLAGINLDSYQKKNIVSGSLSGKVDFHREERFLTGKGDFKLSLDSVAGLSLGKLIVDGVLKPEGKKTSVEADIRGGMVNGLFRGSLVVDIKDLNNSYIEGVFQGRIFGENTRKNIKFYLRNINGVRW